MRCDTFITESTFGLPIYRWDATSVVMADILSWWNANRDAGKTSVIFCYTIGKAQRLLAELARVSDTPVYVHGMLTGMIEGYREAGVMLPDVRQVIERSGRSEGREGVAGRATRARAALRARHAVDAAAGHALGRALPQASCASAASVGSVPTTKGS